jgi:hypothetical protein
MHYKSYTIGIPNPKPFRTQAFRIRNTEMYNFTYVSEVPITTETSVSFYESTPKISKNSVTFIIATERTWSLIIISGSTAL